MERYPIKNRHIAYRVLEGESIIVDFRNSFFFSLNPVGTFIWNLCDGQHSLSNIAAALTEEYEVTTEEAVRDCRQFIDGLVEQQLLYLLSSPLSGEQKHLNE